MDTSEDGGIPTSESGPKRDWNDNKPGGNVDGGHSNGSRNSNGRGVEDSGVYYDDGHVSGSTDVVHENNGHQPFNDDIHYRRASVPTVIHYSDFEDEDVVVVGNMGGSGSGHGEVGNPLWSHANDNAP